VILILSLAEKQYKPPAAKKTDFLKKSSTVPYLKCKPLGFISINYEMAYYTSLKRVTVALMVKKNNVWIVLLLKVSMLNVDDQLKRFAKGLICFQITIKCLK